MPLVQAYVTGDSKEVPFREARITRVRFGSGEFGGPPNHLIELFASQASTLIGHL
jgi:hypothetical protein